MAPSIQHNLIKLNTVKRDRRTIETILDDIKRRKLGSTEILP